MAETGTGDIIRPYAPGETLYNAAGGVRTQEPTTATAGTSVADPRTSTYTSTGTAAGSGGPVNFNFPKPVATKNDSNFNAVPDITNIGGGFLVRFQDGSYDVYTAEDIFGPGSPQSLSPNTAANVALGYAQLQQTAQNQRMQIEADNAKLAEDRRQYDESFGYNKAKFNIEQQYKDAVEKQRIAETNRDFDAAQYWKRVVNDLDQRKFEEDKRQFDLNLGSRPETLMRYFNALRGQDTPQGIGLTPPALPGSPSGGTWAGDRATTLPYTYGDPPGRPIDRLSEEMLPVGSDGPGRFSQTVGVPQEGQPSWLQLFGKEGPVAVSPKTGLTILGGKAVGDGAGIQYRNTDEAGKPINTTDYRDPSLFGTPATTLPGMSAGPGASAQQQLAQAVSAGGMTQAAADLTELLRGQASEDAVNEASNAAYGADGKFKGTVSYAEGGVIPEHVVGVGQDSGETYEFGEEGPEAVVPNDIFEVLMKMGGDIDYSEDDGKKKRRVRVNRRRRGKNSYADGGLIGYQQPNTRRSVFNPEGLSSYLSGKELTPGVPNFPQFNLATGGGQSLIPSGQSLSSMTSSERDLYAGFLRDQAGVPPEDVFDLAKRSIPGTGSLRTPQYTR